MGLGPRPRLQKHNFVIAEASFQPDLIQQDKSCSLPKWYFKNLGCVDFTSLLCFYDYVRAISKVA